MDCRRSRQSDLWWTAIARRWNRPTSPALPLPGSTVGSATMRRTERRCWPMNVSTTATPAWASWRRKGWSG